jgi:hypothetical protein
MESSVNHLSLSFIDVLPKLEITMFPEAPKNGRKTLRVLIVIVLQKRKKTFGHRSRVITGLLYETPETYSLPNLHRKRTIKTDMVKILFRTVTNNTRQGTLDTLVLQPSPCGNNIPTHAPNHIHNLWGIFRHQIPCQKPSRWRWEESVRTSTQSL